MYENVEKFFALYDADPALRERLRLAEEAYPGSLEIREAVAQYVLLPVAEELGLPFSLLDLKVYETRKKARYHRDVALTEEELAQPLEEPHYWLLEHGWEFAKPEEGSTGE